MTTNLTCRFCGQKIKTMAQRLRSDYGEKCKASPSSRHVAIPTGDICVYCGEKVKTIGQVLRTQYSDRCPVSPNSKHALM